ncbi:glycosyltransferase family A protein [Pontimicrobium sp. IMCC45349]|uniref:glycosyltransferase family A protein n=1 Tax=Pontimicrobium sp. IMCC45349 TaxID=3391574 RepID=UPI0039A3ACCD
MKEVDFEILLSTMFRENLDFLNPMFKNNSLKNIAILIVNQTTEDKILTSNSSNIRVINSFEKGSPNSRNLAIKNAVGDICLMADDDVEYLEDFAQIVLNAYKKNKDADVITFEALNKNGDKYMSYPKYGYHTKESLFQVNNIGISFKRASVQGNSVLYSPFFGVGALFPGCTEYVFLRNAKDKGLNMMHVDKPLSIHRNISSGKKQGSDNAIFARTALRYRYFKWFSLPWLLNYLRFILSRGYITRGELRYKFFVGIKAIKIYRKLEKEGKMI